MDVSLTDDLAGALAPAGATLSRVAAAHEVCPPDACYTPEPLDRWTLFLTLSGRAQDPPVVVFPNAPARQRQVSVEIAELALA